MLEWCMALIEHTIMEVLEAGQRDLTEYLEDIIKDVLELLDQQASEGGVLGYPG